MSTENQVHLIGERRIDEKLAVAAITPSHLVELTSADRYQVHSTEGGRANLLFAEIDALQGRSLATAYAAGELVAVNEEVSNNEVQAMLKAGEDVSIGTKLISAGDGTLIAEASASSGVTVEQVIAESREAKDLSGSGAVDSRIRVRLL